jgi:F-type H+-transporting ATPase subunit gamma
MLSRAVMPFGRVQARQPVRGMATAQALRERISSVKNIKKITSAMKMVAVCKLRVAQNGLDLARDFSRPMNDVNFAPKEARDPKSRMYIGISSDRGLCGAINSSISRGIRDAIFAQQEKGMELDNIQISLIGEKARQGLEKLFASTFHTTISEIDKFRPCTFGQTGEITDYWTKNKDPEVTSVFYQKFVSMIAYETTEDLFWDYDTIKDELATEFAEYEMEGDSDILENLHDFRKCVKLYHYFAENTTSTLSARMSAMDNSSKNATDMIDTLTLVLNRSRQAKITTELSEIIAGAAASEEQ